MAQKLCARYGTDTTYLEMTQSSFFPKAEIEFLSKLFFWQTLTESQAHTLVMELSLNSSVLHTYRETTPT